LVCNLDISSHLSWTPALEPHPPAVGVEVHVEHGAVALDARLRVESKRLLGCHVQLPPDTPPENVPVPTIDKPVALKVDLKTPKIAWFH